MPHPRFSSEEVVRRGEAIYARDLQARLEPDHHGEIVVIDIESGDHWLGPDEAVALRAARAGRPNAALYVMRVGFPTAVRIGARSVRAAR